MAIAFDAAQNLGIGASTRSYSHTPTGTPAGVAVVIVSESADANYHTTAVTYGGQALSVASQQAKLNTEWGAVQIWFLGASIPTGTQTVAITRDDANDYIATSFTMTSATNQTEITTSSGNWNASTASLGTSLTIPNGLNVFMCGGALSGANTISMTDSADISASRTQQVDLGNVGGVINRGTNIYTGTGAAYTGFSWTQSAEDGAWTVTAFAEKAVGANSQAKLRVGGAWVNADVKVRQGGAWVVATPKVRQSSSWV